MVLVSIATAMEKLGNPTEYARAQATGRFNFAETLQNAELQVDCILGPFGRSPLMSAHLVNSLWQDCCGWDLFHLGSQNGEDTVAVYPVRGLRGAGLTFTPNKVSPTLTDESLERGINLVGQKKPLAHRPFADRKIFRQIPYRFRKIDRS